MRAFKLMQMIATKVPERTLPLFRPIPELFFPDAARAELRSPFGLR